MSSKYSIDALTDEERRLMDAIEADLDRVMAVEPSADFAARVRVRIGEADRDARWNVPWALAAAAVLVIAAGVLVATLRDRPAGLEPAKVVAGHDVPLPAPTLPPAVAAAGHSLDAASASVRPAEMREVSSGSRIPDPGSRLGQQTTRTDEPEVLVPQDLRLAVDRVMAMVRAGTLNERALPAERAAAVAEESAVPAPMVVEELQVRPIGPAGGAVEKGFGSN